VRSAEGKWNLPQNVAGDGPEPLDLRPLRGARIALTDARVHLQDASAGFEAETELRFDWSGPMGRGRLTAGEGARWRPGGSDLDAAGAPAAERAAAVEALGLEPASLLREGGSVNLEGPDMVTPEGRMAVSGRVEQVEGDPRLQVAVDGHADVGLLAGPPWRGRLVLRASATGPLAAPALEAKARGEGLAVADLAVEATASAREEDGTWRLQAEGRIAGGRIIASGAVPSTGDARAEGRWDGLDAARLLRPFADLQRRPGPAGRRSARWPAGAF
jgi:hypothetical protein